MRVDESRNHDFAATVYFVDSLFVLLDPGIMQCVFGFTDRNNFAPDREHSSIFDDAEFAERGTAARTVTGSRAEGEKLADVK
jgi:hypothetical protein